MSVARACFQFELEDGSGTRSEVRLQVVRAQEGHYMAYGDALAPVVGPGDSWQDAALDALQQHEERERRRQAAHTPAMRRELTEEDVHPAARSPSPLATIRRLA